MKTFKFGRSYKNPIYDVGIESFAQSVGLSRDMIQRLEQQRIHQHEEAAARQRESIERGIQIHMEILERKREDYDIHQRESIKRYVEERDELTRRRWDEQKRYGHGF